MTVMHTHSSAGGFAPFAAPDQSTMAGSRGFLSSSPTTSSSSSSSSLGYGRGGGDSGDVKELAIVQHYTSKFSNDALKAQDAADNSVKAIFIIKFDVNEGARC
jgi:hypothetical protein